MATCISQFAVCTPGGQGKPDPPVLVPTQALLFLDAIFRYSTEEQPLTLDALLRHMEMDPVYLNAIVEKAPKNWDQMNLAAVIETHVIEGHPGPPTVVAVDTW